MLEKTKFNDKEHKILLIALEHLMSNLQAGNEEVNYEEVLKLSLKIERGI